MANMAVARAASSLRQMVGEQVLLLIDAIDLGLHLGMPARDVR
jgi:hypothetical protein